MQLFECFRTIACSKLQKPNVLRSKGLIIVELHGKFTQYIMNLSNSEHSSFCELGVECDDLSKLGNYTWVRRGSIIKNSTIDQDVFLGFRVEVYGSEIGTGCLIASRTVIGSISRPVTKLGPYVWVGAQVTIDAGVTVGEGAVIGGGAHVTEDVPPYAIVVGRPARQIRTREVVDHAPPKFSHLLNSIRERSKTEPAMIKEVLELLGSHSQDASAAYAALIRREVQNQECEIGQGTFLDADFRMGSQVTIGDSVIAIGRQIKDLSGNVLIDGGIEIGDHVQIGDHVILEGGGKIKIGAGTRIDRDVHIVSSGHDMKKLSMPLTMEPVYIGQEVVIGANALILGGVSIGDGAVIAPNAIVTKNVPAHTQHHGTLRKESSIK